MITNAIVLRMVIKVMAPLKLHVRLDSINKIHRFLF